MNANANGTLGLIFDDILKLIKPQQEDWAIRFQVIEELRKVVESVESFRDASVEPFGSFVSNLFTRSGDLDISIHLSYSSHITFTGKKHKQKLLADLLGALRNDGGYRKLQFLQHARVPILKFESNRKRILCDISIDNLQGQIKSKFLLWLCEIDGRFRDMVLLVKEWAKAHDINNSKGGTFNSYTLCLLIIFHFQTCTPPIFPPLRDIYPRNAVDDLVGVRVNAERQIAETCAANIHRFRTDRYRPINRSSLPEIFISFLAKFSGLSSKVNELGICPYTGQWEKLSDNTRWMPKTYAMFVEDPFEQPENTARTVGSGQLARISEVFEFSYHRIRSGNQNPSSLVALLSRPHVAQSLTRAMPSRNERQTGGQSSYFNPQAYRGAITMQQRKEGLDNSRLISGNGYNKHRSVQQNHQALSSHLPSNQQPALNHAKPQQTVKQDQKPHQAGGQSSNFHPQAYHGARTMQQQREGFDNSKLIAGNGYNKHKPVQQNHQASSSHKPLNQQPALNHVKPQHTVKQDQKQRRQAWKPLVKTANTS